MRGQRISYSQDELAWIKGRSTEPRATAHELFVQVWNRPDVSLINFSALCKRNGWTTGRTGQFVQGVRRDDNPARKGYSPAGCEKGWFKKGIRQGVATRLHQPIGTLRVTKDGYIERKVNDDLPLRKRWQAVHRLEWEAIHGPVPTGHALKCLDGDKTNTAPANWTAIPLALLPRLNGRYGRDYDASPPELKPTIMAIAKLEHKARTARADIERGGV
jgi:hypothetical protein